MLELFAFCCILYIHCVVEITLIIINELIHNLFNSEDITSAEMFYFRDLIISVISKKVSLEMSFFCHWLEVK